MSGSPPERKNNVLPIRSINDLTVDAHWHTQFWHQYHHACSAVPQINAYRYIIGTTTVASSFCLIGLLFQNYLRLGWVPNGEPLVTADCNKYEICIHSCYRYLNYLIRSRQIAIYKSILIDWLIIDWLTECNLFWRH